MVQNSWSVKASEAFSENPVLENEFCRWKDGIKEAWETYATGADWEETWN